MVRIFSGVGFFESLSSRVSPSGVSDCPAGVPGELGWLISLVK
jgi:hypothetical protein